MCIFCAAIPISMTLGIKAVSKQRKEARLAESEGKESPHKVIDAGTVSAVVVGGLVVASVIYHTKFAGPF